MTLSRPAKAFVAIFTATFLLLCQSASLANVCLTQALEPGAPAAAMPCHGAVEDGDSTSNTSAAPSVCDASQAIPETANVPVFALATVPVLIIAARDVVTRFDDGITQPVHAVCSSPPFTVLHCRFLI